MKKVLDMKVVSTQSYGPRYQYIGLKSETEPLGEILPGQFVNIRIDNSASTFLRRPISVCDVEGDILWLLVARVGAGTNALCDTPLGTTVNVLLPLGNGFDISENLKGKKVLLCGGGVGTAPLLYYGKVLKGIGAHPEFLLAARDAGQFVLEEKFEAVAPTHFITDDGSRGEKGYAAQSSVFSRDFDRVAVCGPSMMMRTVASTARRRGLECEVSLENMMACGLGACLCCVEKTVQGNRCACTDGPVFNVNELTWEL